ncbi:formylglycine-generating enzyme family protein [Fulvivirgaceae bacterium PWU4]|uniref:Formylglycine-generating enzyme family protein n=1 Tax=Chryseosolibacter histidini TaxID=2782349 RepID=A0AAP2DLJ1_9BACT|nr:formylglycine-generating enzyme family protein [Chryseosolibacter histidini]MBT1697352.1 formylglycine-generating enzyme family protein [Chryseosolibacter histidini]
MTDFDIHFPEINYRFPLTFVKGTGETTYLFGDGDKVGIHVNDFFISKFQITQKLWEYIMGNSPSHFGGQDKPVENVSFNDITQKSGFLDKLNLITGDEYKLTFRLPSETEWEYAARGGTHWIDDFQFSGSNNINDVGWYDQNSGKYNDLEILSKLKNREKGTTTHDVGQKQPNQLGIFDMSGNIWEWCQDYFQSDIRLLPKDGTPYLEEGNEIVLRGGCHHNWANHCTVSKRYAIVPDAKDECIGFRIAASINV